MVQCMMTERSILGTNAPRKTARCKVVLTMRPSLLGRNNRRRDQSRHSEKNEKLETTGTINFFKAGHRPRFIFSMRQLRSPRSPVNPFSSSDLPPTSRRAQGPSDT
jgi:hypothetical protein